MPSTAVTDWDTTAANNTDVGGTDIDEGCAPSGINNAIREIMAQVATAIANGDMVADGQVDGNKLATNAVSTTAKITDGIITTAKLAAALQKFLLPIGSVSPYAGTTEPTGWRFCRGQEMSRTTFSDLFAVIGTTYGAGDGSTTFNLPELRGRVVAGRDSMGGVSANRLTNQSGGLNGDVLGNSGGNETHTLTEAQLANHDHNNGVGNLDGDIFVYSTTTEDLPGNAIDNPQKATLTSTLQGITGTAGSGQAHNNVQPTFILNYMIFTGV